MKSNPLFLTIILLLAGCVSVARIADLPKTADEINFDAVARAGARTNDGTWNTQTDYEYYVEITGSSPEALHKALETAIVRAGYKAKKSDKINHVVIGERGVSMAEWGAVTGIYYRVTDNLTQVYFKNILTQDFTGSWRENRAKTVADLLCTELIACRVRLAFKDRPPQ